MVQQPGRSIYYNIVVGAVLGILSIISVFYFKSSSVNMAPIKMTYFDVTALGEPIRFLFAYGGMEFEDERLNEEQFAPRKQSFPYGKLPVVEMEGKTAHQSMAIARYIAKKVGLTGKTDWDALECDIMVDTIVDLRAAMQSFAYEEHVEAKAQKREQVMGTQVPYYLGKFEKHLADNGGHFVNGQLTWTDFVWAGMCDYLKFMSEKDLYAEYPKLKALQDKVLALPQLQKYIAARPPVEF